MLITLENVEKHYSGFHLNCSMEVPEGCVTALIGPNGAGKSTTFKAILGLIFPEGGKIELFGKPLEQLTAEDREQMGFVLSDSCFSGYLNLEDLVPILDRMYRRFDRKDFLERCGQFGLPMGKKLKEFSTGMKAKLKVLIAMSHGARLLILDEPTAGLDPMGRIEILHQIKQLQQETGLTILLVSHSMEDVAEYVDRIIVMNKGKILFDDIPREVFSHYKELEEVGLAAPQVTYVLHALKDRGFDVDVNATTVEEAARTLERAVSGRK